MAPERKVKARARTVDEYLAALSSDKRAALQRLRRIIRAAAPGAEERISYQIPAFRLDGKWLVWIGAAANHCAIYGVVGDHRDELKDYDTSGRGTIRFQPDKPLPAALVRKLVKARIVKNGAERAARRRAKPVALLVVLALFAASVHAAPERKAKATDARRSVGIGCVALPRGWQVSLEQQSGWVSGQIQHPATASVMAFAIVTGAGTPAASPARRDQFEWLKTEKLGRALLHYGLERKSDGRPVLEASVIGGGVTANFVTPERDARSLPSLLAVARSYSPEKCPQ